MKIPPFQLERYFAQYEFNTPYLLCSSDAESFSIKELLQFEPNAQEQLNELWLGYTESQGGMRLREAITELYENIQPSQILVHAGAEEAIFNFMNIALKPGDHIIVHAPNYQSLSEVAASIGANVTLWITNEDDDWELDLGVLQDSIGANTKVIVINCPHNPTGYLMSSQKLQAIIEIARKHNLILFSDEVYRFSEYNPVDRLPAACDQYENAVSLGVMSKTFGLAGLRIGWIVTRNAEIYKQMASFKDYVSICNSAPSEFLAVLALKYRDFLIKRNVDLMIKNHQILSEFFHQYSKFFSWRPPKAGTVAFPSIRFDQDIDAFCSSLIRQKGVLLLPGSLYNYGKRHFRIGFGRQNFPEAMVHFEAFIQDNILLKI